MLTQKQETFTLCLFQGLTQRQAYIKAGYNPPSTPAILDVRASELAANSKVIVRLAELRQKAEDASVATYLEACQVATEIIRGRFSDFATCGADGVYIDIGPEKMHSAALKKVKSKTTYDDNGSNAAVVTDIELESKLDAIEKLARLKKWYTEAPSIQDNRTINIIVQDTTAKELVERLVSGSPREPLVSQDIDSNQSPESDH